MLKYSYISFADKQLAIMYRNKVLATYIRRAITIKKTGENKVAGSVEGLIVEKKNTKQNINISTDPTALNIELNLSSLEDASRKKTIK